MDKGSILILSPWPSIFSMGAGGTPRGQDLVETLLAAGYGIDYVAPKAKENDWIPTHDRLRVHRFGPLRLPSRGYAGYLISWFERTIRLIGRGVAVAMRHGRPTVVYAWSSLTVPAGLCCGLLLRRPTIGALFGTFLYPHLGSRRGRLNLFQEILAFKSPVDRLLILNDGTRGDDVARALGVPESRVRFWMHGLDLECCSAAREAHGRAQLALPSDVPLVLSASRLVGWKRIDRLLRAAPDILAARPETLFVISGDGPQRHAFEALTRELSVEHAVRFLGALPRDANLRLIASADVFCALYDYSCVGVALLEALGCGVAVVVADTGATRNFVEDEVNGLVVTPDDHVGTAAAITRLIDDPALRLRLGSTARRLAEERFLTAEQRASLELETIAELASDGETRLQDREEAP
jgi:glycosyltransferase involved in cell wall biosynthesis